MTAEYLLPAQRNEQAALRAEGFVTPHRDTTPQCARFLPRTVIPILFLPGIMGSNLKLSSTRQGQLKKGSNVAWRPDAGLEMLALVSASPAERQLQLDPAQTEVDIYDPKGDRTVSGDHRHRNVRLDDSFDSPLLRTDPPAASTYRTATQKARARGWGEVMFSSYGQVLQYLESRLNNTFDAGRLNPAWQDIVGQDPARWGLHPDHRASQPTLTEDALKRFATGRWFPVHAIGYNWLASNGQNADHVAERIRALMADYVDQGYACDQVVLVTHSMGGLLARALIHPELGTMQDQVLGIVHGVMPAVGAPAAYKRMRTGFEDPGMLDAPQDSVAAKILGNRGDEVTAVLANAPGGLELLPSQAYPGAWLRVTHQGRELAAWPKGGDPYEEIYLMRDKWYSLIREEWLGPADRLLSKDGMEPSRNRTFDYLKEAKAFHSAISNTFHQNTYAHYGADPDRPSFASVSWEISDKVSSLEGWEDWQIARDDARGGLLLTNKIPGKGLAQPLPSVTFEDLQPDADAPTRSGFVHVSLGPSDGKGDQTVPTQSAEHALHSGVFRGVFRQAGYEHQASYMDRHALASTLFGIVRVVLNKEAAPCQA